MLILLLHNLLINLIFNKKFARIILNIKFSIFLKKIIIKVYKIIVTLEKFYFSFLLEFIFFKEHMLKEFLKINHEESYFLFFIKNLIFG